MKQPLLVDNPVTLEFVKHGKEMIEKEMWAEQSWRLLNTTARKHGSFHVPSSSRSLWCADCRGCTGKGSLGTCSASNTFFSKQLLLAVLETCWEAAGLWGWLWTSVLRLLPLPFCKEKQLLLPALSGPFEPLLQTLSLEHCEGSLQGSLPFAVQNSPGVFNRLTKRF